MIHLTKMARMINGIKHMYLNDNNDFKKKSLEDNLNFTLRDIFWNSDSADVCMIADAYNNMLTVSLHQKNDIGKILRWLERITPVWFEFAEELQDGENIIEEEYMVFDDWWKQFEELRKLLREKY